MGHIVVLRAVATCCLSLALAAAAAQAGRPRRVRFEEGRISAAVEGKVARGSVQRYVVRGEAGEGMVVNLASPGRGARFDIRPARGRAALRDGAGVTLWGGRLPATGDYVISVYTRRRESSYVLEVIIV